MTISASMVKDLRDKTGAGMMDCKAALNETGGDFEAAVDWLRKKGIAKAAKKSSRIAAEGMVNAWAAGTKGAMVEVNSETDFVAKNDTFRDFVSEVTSYVASSGTTDVEAIKTMPWHGGTNGAATVGDKLTAMVGTIGENMTLRRAAYLSVESGLVKSYIHMGGKIGVLVAIKAANTTSELDDIAKNVAMHIAAANPQALNRDQVNPELIARERSVFTEQAKASGKPDNIAEKIVEGRISKFFEEICLVDQAFIMDTDRKVGDVVKAAGGEITSYVRFALGEGIEKEETDFASEVAAAVNA